MSIRSRLVHSLQIARIECTRSQRQRGRSDVFRAVFFVCILALALGSGVGAYVFGTLLHSGEIALSAEFVQRVATAGFLALLVGLMQRTFRLLSRIKVTHLLTTVSTAETILGIAGAVLWPAVIWLAPIIFTFAIGFAVGAHWPAGIVTLCIAGAGLLVLAALLGVALSFTVKVVTTRSPRFRRYRGIIAVIAFVFVAGIFSLANAGLVSIDELGEWASYTPVAWFVDFGFWGTSLVHSGVLPIMGSLAVLGAGIPVVTIGTTLLAKRVWETEPVSATILHHSRSLVGTGTIERLLAKRLSRPVLTVMRKRWLQERRVPVAVSMLGYLLVLLPIVYLPMLFTGRILLVSPLSLAVVLGPATGLCFGITPIGAEYSSFPMTLTAISGRHFVCGEILAGVTIGTPITVITTVLLALGSPVGTLETIAVGIASGMLSVCGMTLAVALGMSVSYSDLLPAPLPLSSATIYAEIGWMEFVRLGVLLGILGLVCVPGFAGYLLVFLEPMGATVIVSQPLIRIGALLLMSGLAAAASGIAYQRAVRAFDQYVIS